MSYEQFDDKTLQERVADNPRPVAIWLAGLFALLALEYSKIAGGLVAIGSNVRWIVEGVATIPGETAAWVGSFAPGIETVVLAFVWLFVLFFAGVTVNWLFVPGSLSKRLGLEYGGPGVQDIIEWVTVSLLVAVTGLLLVFTPLGSIVDSVLASLTGGLESVGEMRSLTDRDLISNEGHRTADGGWEGTFLGLSPAQAWVLRVAVVYLYALAVVYWLWRGYKIFREHYREADWTPRDDTVDVLRNHYWGLFGIVVVFGFLVMAVWPESISPTPAEADIFFEYENEFTYFDEDLGEPVDVLYGTANVEARSDGQNTVGVWSYDQYDRFHPLGTTVTGSSMTTFLAHGARTSLVLGITATAIGALIAVVLGLVTAFYKGAIDLITVVTSDSIIAMPQLLLILLIVTLFQDADHAVVEVYGGGLLLALIFGFTTWPFLWRAIRGPALQVAEQEWVDAAKSFGQSPATTMRKHMSPYIAGYMLIYASLQLGGIIIGIAALTFLGLGIEPPTPEWGRLVDRGQPYVSTSSWHVATIPGVLVVLVVTAFNAMGDGIRDAIDPESESASEGAAAAGGGG